MNDISYWTIFGIVCFFLELLLPGFVLSFLGLGAVTVSVLVHYGYLSDITMQFSTFFILSIIYLFTLRVLILHYFPTDTIKANVNEDDEVIGQTAKVLEAINVGASGRIEHSDSSWSAKSHSSEPIKKGELVKIIGRDNITWLVEKI